MHDFIAIMKGTQPAYKQLMFQFRSSMLVWGYVLSAVALQAFPRLWLLLVNLNIHALLYIVYAYVCTCSAYTCVCMLNYTATNLKILTRFTLRQLH